MDAVHSLLSLLPSIVFGVGTVITLLAVRRAPVGTEGEEGFRAEPAAIRSRTARTHAETASVPAHGVRLA